MFRNIFLLIDKIHSYSVVASPLSCEHAGTTDRFPKKPKFDAGLNQVYEVQNFG